MFEAILSEIRMAGTIVIHRHKNPDGDALGSQIGLKHILQDAFPDKRIYAVGDAAGRYAFMEDSQMDTIDDTVYADALSIVLDTSAHALVSDDRYRTAARTARIDHHIFLEQMCQTEVTDTSFESCCGMITQLAQESGLPVSSLAAKSLYTGMVTDSGRFRYDSTSAQTFRLAAFLMERPFDTNGIYRELYADTPERIRLKAQFTLKIQFTAHKVAYIYTTREELRQLEADTFSISRGMVGTMADMRGVDIWANFTETDEGVLCELRSSGYNINPIAVKYGGGGHAKACGATVPDRNTAMRLLQELDSMIGDHHE